jgi:hypothetical protein
MPEILTPSSLESSDTTSLTLESQTHQTSAGQPDKQAQFEIWKQERETQQQERNTDRRAQLDEILKTAPRKELSPQALAEQERRRLDQAELTRKIELQLDTEELVAGLGAVGIGRLRHPIRTARILAVAAKRMAYRQYNPDTSHDAEFTSDGFLNPFTEDPVAQARIARRIKRADTTRQAAIFNPFEY